VVVYGGDGLLLVGTVREGGREVFFVSFFCVWLDGWLNV
jgi:hypothetical protein